MQVNSDKRKQKEITKINNLKLKLLENDLDFNFIFETYLNKVCKNANQLNKSPCQNDPIRDL